MLLETGMALANEVVEMMRPYCRRIEVAGSIRRRRPKVHDIDIVFIGQDWWQLNALFNRLGAKGGGKMKHFLYKQAPVDLYFADEESWATLLLIRTGPVESNIRLCGIAKARGWHLYANGDGLFNQDGKRIAGDTEESIYLALGQIYQPPTKRD